MNVQFGFSFNYSAWTGGQAGAQPPAANGADHSCQCGPQTPAAAVPSTPAVAAQPVLVGYLTPAYLLAAPQTAQFSAQAGHALPASSGLAGPGGEAAGGHVVTNATNALVGGSGGFSAAAGPLGGFAPFAQGVAVSPVFLQLGYPLAFGYVAAPQAGAPAPVAAPAGQDGAADVEADPVEAPAVPTAGTPVADPADDADATDTTGDRPRVSIDSIDTADFQRYRFKQLAASLETSLQLELETREGDRVVLDFSQLDTRERSRLRAVDEQGGRVRSNQVSSSTERLVNIEVTGELSEAERAAVDQVLDQVLELAREFFTGSFADAVARLDGFEFDSSSLLELSLDLSVTRQVSVARGYGRGGDAVGRLAERDGEVAKVLEFFADGQRRLIDSAQQVLDDPSAVKLVQNLLGPLLSTPEEAARTLKSELVEHTQPPEQPAPAA